MNFGSSRSARPAQRGHYPGRRRWWRGLRKGGWSGWKPSSSSDFSIRAFRVHPPIEIRQAVLDRAIRGNSISVSSQLSTVPSPLSGLRADGGCRVPRATPPAAPATSAPGRPSAGMCTKNNFHGPRSKQRINLLWINRGTINRGMFTKNLSWACLPVYAWTDRGVRFHRIRDFKQYYYFSSIPLTSHLLRLGLALTPKAGLLRGLELATSLAGPEANIMLLWLCCY